MTGRSQEDKAADFAELHRGEPFLIPNPWDGGTARLLEDVGYKALATTSGGLAFALGRVDGEVTLDEVAAHVRVVSAASDLPLTVDLENGFGPEPEDVARAIEAAAQAGAVGGSIEDYDPDSGELYEIAAATERIAAAHEAAATCGSPFLLTGRSEAGFRGEFDLGDTIARLAAYADGGADVLYAPGLPDIEAVREICAAATKPVNVIGRRRFTVPELFEAGAQRVSIGASLTWTAMEATADAAEKMLNEGDFSGLGSSRRLRDWYSPG